MEAKDYTHSRKNPKIGACFFNNAAESGDM